MNVASVFAEFPAQAPVAETGSEWPVARRVLFASCVGTTLEYYDFFIYGPIAALVFAKVFFPQQAEGTALLLSLATFAIGFLARPIGAVVGGHLGDQFGRKRPMLASVVIMGLATFAIGCLPTYALWGIWAPILLVLLRCVQGVAVGMEWGGAALMLVEHAPASRRALYGSLAHAAAPAGTILSSGVIAVVSGLLSTEQMLEWGWRLPFLLSVFLLLVGIYLRLRVQETPVFRRLEAMKAQSRLPVLAALRRRPVQVLASMGVKMGDTANGFILVIFVLGYATRHAGLSPNTVLSATIAASLVALAATPLVGHFSDRFGPTTPIAIGGAAMIAWGFPMFWLVNTGSVMLVYLVFCIGLLITCLIATPVAALYAQLFEPKMRYSGMSLGFHLGGVLGGGLSPLIAQALQNAAGGATWPVSVYLMVVGLIVLGSVAVARRSVLP
ncbi:MFS transporter [Variovorax sp. Sphag1AA]|uniref:MFS transporter n=1 Tax=Variovorax sp. Sphag1AA TaxID=2587027 RepID=UPI00160846E9|nr:MFS transporter [Variovorax sp. Sphag1AA]MBB3178137.1 MFS family permease [Variovorax sp. Sphag1AA]